MKTKWMMMALVSISGLAQAAFVTIGNASNAADTTGYGAVGYTYQISATDVTIAEMQASGAGSGNENYWNSGGRTVGTAAPAVNVSLYEAMKYCNWLTSGNINNGAYQFSGGIYQSTARASAISTYGTVYALPTEDEWYKAAYYKPDNSGYSLYANGTGTVPTWGGASGWNYYNNGFVNGNPNYVWTVGSGGEEQNGTYNMMGNVYELMETASAVIRGGVFNSLAYELRSTAGYTDSSPENEATGIGFRVVAVNVVPEPASAMLVFFGAGVGWVIHRARRSALRR